MVGMEASVLAEELVGLVGAVGSVEATETAVGPVTEGILTMELLGLPGVGKVTLGRNPAFSMKRRLLLLLIVFVVGAALCKVNVIVHDLFELFLLVAVSFVMSAFSDYFLIEKRSFRDGLRFAPPSVDQPLFQSRGTVQCQFDVALGTVGFGLGGVFWTFVIRHSLSYESLIAIAWGLGSLSGIRLYLKRPAK